MFLFIHLIIFFISFCLFFLYLHYIRINGYVKHLPSVPFRYVWPLYNLKNTKTPNYFDIFYNLTQSMTGVAKFWLGYKLAIVCDDPNDIHTILMSKECVEKPYIYRLVVAAGDGIFSSKGNHIILPNIQNQTNRMS